MEVQQRTAAELYLDLLRNCLTRYLFGESYVPAVPPRGTLKHTAFEPVRRRLAGKDMEVIRHVRFDEQTRAEGRDWPARAESMAGLRRLENLQFCVTDVLRRGVPGDLIETGACGAG
jgi:O-methyltransferase